jgi:DNA-binding SARP family transcriptional activator
VSRGRYQLQLAGVFVLRYQGEPIELRFEKVRALLVLLVAKGGEIERHEAASLLWPELESSSARNNLRLALHRFKSALRSDWPQPVASTRRLIALENERFGVLPSTQSAQEWLQARGLLLCDRRDEGAMSPPFSWLLALYGQRATGLAAVVWAQLKEQEQWHEKQKALLPALVRQDEQGWCFVHPLFRHALLLSLAPEGVQPFLQQMIHRLLKLARGAMKQGGHIAQGIYAAAKALALLRHLADRPLSDSLRIDLELVLASLLQHQRGLGCVQAGALLDRAADRASDLGRMDRIFAAFFGRWQSSLVGGDPWVADVSARRLERYAAHDPLSRAATLLATGRNRMVGGELSAALEHLERAARVSAESPERLVLGGMDIGVLSEATLSQAYWLKGAFTQAQEAANRALTLANQAEATARCACAATVGSYYRLDGQVRALSNLANEGMRTASKAHLPFWQMACFFQNVWTLVSSGQKEAVGLLEGRLDTMRSALGGDRMAYALAVLESYFEAGRYGLCAQCAQQAIEQGFCEQEVLISEYYRLWARSLMKLGSRTESIEACYQKGQEFATYFQSPSLILALNMDRAYFLLSQKRNDEAIANLAEALVCFEQEPEGSSQFLLKGRTLLKRLKER